MGRQVELKYIEDEVSRQACFSKRRNGLLRKAYETSVLCGVDVAFLAFSPSGRLNHFASDKRIEEVLTRFVSLPEDQREYPIQNPEGLLQLLSRLQKETERRTFATDQFSAIEEEINRVKKQIQIGEARLRNNYEPDPETVTTIEEAEEREKFIQDTLDRLMERKMELIKEQNRSLQTGQHSQTLDQQQLQPEPNYSEHLISDANGGLIGGSIVVPLTDPTYQINELLISQNESSPVVNHPSHQTDDDRSLGKSVDSLQVDQHSMAYKSQDNKFNEGNELMVSQPLQNNDTTDCPTSTECFEHLNSPLDWLEGYGMSLDIPITVDTPSPNPHNNGEFDPNDELFALHTVGENLVAPDNQNDSKSGGVLEPSSTSSLSPSQVFNILNQADTGLFPVEFPKHLVPDVDFGNNMYVKDDYGLPSFPEDLQSLGSSNSSYNHLLATANFSSDPPTAQPEFGPGNGVIPSSFNPEQLNSVPQDNNQPMQNFNRSEPFILPRSQQTVNDNQPAFNQNINQSERFILPRPPRSLIDPNSICYPFSPTFQNNFMPRGLPIMPPRASGNNYMGMLNQVMGSAVGQHGYGMPMQPQMGMGMPSGHFMPPIQPQLLPKQVNMGHNVRPNMLQNQYPGVPPNYYMGPEMRPMVQNQMEGTSPIRGKRKLSSRDGNSLIGVTDRVNPYPQQVGANQNQRLNHPYRPMNNKSQASQAQNLNVSNPINQATQAQNLNVSNPINQATQAQNLNVSNPIYQATQAQNLNVSNLINQANQAQNLNVSNLINRQLNNTHQAQNLNGSNPRPMNAPRLFLAPGPSVYDPLYARIGSHVDPHLRLLTTTPRPPTGNNTGQVIRQLGASNPTDQPGLGEQHGRNS